jgi:hypothetical protein
MICIISVRIAVSKLGLLYVKRTGLKRAYFLGEVFSIVPSAFSKFR